MNALKRLALDKLTRVLGAERAGALWDEILAQTGLPEVSTPNDLLVVANALTEREGFVRVVGHSLQAKATILGAELSEAQQGAA